MVVVVIKVVKHKIIISLTIIASEVIIINTIIKIDLNFIVTTYFVNFI